MKSYNPYTKIDKDTEINENYLHVYRANIFSTVLVAKSRAIYKVKYEKGQIKCSTC